MGQKSNLLTLRKLKFTSNLLTSNPKEFIYGLKFLKFLNNLFFKKNIIIIKNDINFESNKLFLNIVLFFRSVKLLKYQKIYKFQKSKKLFLNLSPILYLIKTHFSILSNNYIQISFTNLNHSIKKHLFRRDERSIRCHVLATGASSTHKLWFRVVLNSLQMGDFGLNFVFGTFLRKRKW